jgi:hypothetical protein
MDKLSYQIYILLQDEKYDEIGELIHDINLNNNNSGIISNVLLYYIKVKNTNKINEMLNYSLKKRDYLNICEYFYDSKGVEIFETILDKFDWETKDIDYMIENKLYKLLYCMKNIYVETSFSSNSNYVGEYNKNIKDVNEIYSYLLNKNMNMKNDINKKYDIIIDGCNLIFSSKVYTPMELINKYLSLLNGYSVLLVIHKRHRKKLCDINVDIYYTEYKMNDDLFILKYYCLLEDSFILTNDEFNDHLHGMRKQTKDILHDKCIRYNNFIIYFPINSKCIQIKNSAIYIPVKKTNLFYEINNV